jgi:hypothetical protein
MPLKINQHPHPINFAKPFNLPSPMLPHPPHQISRHPNIQNPIRPAAQNINPAAMLFHFFSDSTKDINNHSKRRDANL